MATTRRRPKNGCGSGRGPRDGSGPRGGTKACPKTKKSSKK